MTGQVICVDGGRASPTPYTARGSRTPSSDRSQAQRHGQGRKGARRNCRSNGCGELEAEPDAGRAGRRGRARAARGRPSGLRPGAAVAAGGPGTAGRGADRHRADVSGPGSSRPSTRPGVDRRRARLAGSDLRLGAAALQRRAGRSGGARCNGLEHGRRRGARGEPGREVRRRVERDGVPDRAQEHQRDDGRVREEDRPRRLAVRLLHAGGEEEAEGRARRRSPRRTTTASSSAATRSGSQATRSSPPAPTTSRSRTSASTSTSPRSGRSPSARRSSSTSATARRSPTATAVSSSRTSTTRRGSATSPSAPASRRPTTSASATRSSSPSARATAAIVRHAVQLRRPERRPDDEGDRALMDKYEAAAPSTPPAP